MGKYCSLASPAEIRLKESSTIRLASDLRRQVLACMACQFAQCKKVGEPQRTFVQAVSTCIGANPGSIYRCVAVLREAGILEEVPEATQVSIAGRSRVYLGPAATERARDLVDAITPPRTCELASQVPSIDRYLFGDAVRQIAS